MMSNQDILDSAFRAWQQSGSKQLFAVWLYSEKSNGKYWSA